MSSDAPSSVLNAADCFNEARVADGGLRPHWRHLEAFLRPEGHDELFARRESIRKNLDELGVTYNVYADSQGLERPWQLDPFPLLIQPDEWASLELGLAQRTRLFNAILRDLYGQRRLISSGLLPAEFVYANPLFLRPCDGIRYAHDLPLILHGINLARREDGSWCVLSDRTQSPSGLGYALANRIVLSRVMPDEFRTANVRRLASFFVTMRETLRSLCQTGSDMPSIALLTPGPFNETYFEHSFLARYLGITLVEGGDLIIRDQRVFIKTLEGLRPVDVLIKRVDDLWCDPLELRNDSILGVPGLLHAVRQGRVSVVNAFGSSILESPVLHRFLPALCRFLLGEELLIPGVETLWSGNPEDQERLLNTFDHRVIKRSFGGSTRLGHQFTSKLDDEARRRLIEDMRFNALDFTAQERVRLSRLPTIHEGEIQDRPVVFRAFTCAAHDKVSVLPGGLTRVSTSAQGLIISMQAGGISKDTWILSDKPVSNVSLLRPATQVIRLERAPAEVPSRVADNLFWLGRYAERLEDTCRLLRTLLSRLTLETGSDETPEIGSLVQILARLELFPERLLQRRSLAAIERESMHLIYHADRLGTVKEVHSRLQTLSFSLRDRFTGDTQRILMRLQGALRQPEQQPTAANSLDVLNNMILNLAAFSGMEMENMTRGHAWRFLDMGRRLERAVNIVSLLQNGLIVRDLEATAPLQPILEIADSVMTFRRRYFGHPEWPTVADLLIADDSNPRSFAFQIAALLEHVQRLPAPRRDALTGPNRELKQLQMIRNSLAQLVLEDLSEGDREGTTNPLPTTLGNLASSLRGISDGITQKYFAHTPPRAT